jgi:hypothetical protein
MPTDDNGAPSTIRVDEPTATNTYSAGQTALQEHRDALLDHDGEGLDDPLTTAALTRHTRTTRDRFTTAHQDLADGKTAAATLAEEDRRGTHAITAANNQPTGGLTALREALSQPVGAASPFAAAPTMPMMTAPAPPPAAMPAPAVAMPAPTPMPMAPGMVNADTGALTKLIATANITAPEQVSASERRSSHTGQRPAGGGKAPLGLADVAIQPTGLGTLTRSQLHAVIDQALDNNGITTEPSVRSLWHELLYQQYMKESAGVVDAVNRNDANAHGATVTTDNAPAGSSRGIG